MIDGGTVNFNGTDSTGALTESSGTLGGSGTLTVSGQTTWTGGTMSGTGSTVADGGLAITVSDTDTVQLDARTLSNGGSGTLAGSFYLEAGNNAIINNLSGATFDVQSSAGIRGNSPYIGGSATFNNQGTLTKSTGSGTSISAVLNNTGNLEVDAGALTLTSGSINIDGNSFFVSQASTTLALTGNLLSTTNLQSNFNPLGTVLLDGSGTASTPQQFEAMSDDLGAVAAGFINNFTYGNLTLGSGTHVKLVDTADNSSGSGSEAVYAETLAVPAGTTLDLNGLHLYTRADLISGTVTGGTISVVNGGGPIAINMPTPGDLTTFAQQDNWTFNAQAGQAVNVTVATGSGSTPAPLSPSAGFVTVNLLDSNNNVLATKTNSQSGNPAQLLGVNLPNTGTYRIVVQGSAGHTGYYIVTLGPAFATKATPNVAVSDAGGTYNGLPWPASATVAGIDGTVRDSLESVTPTLLYYAGATASGTGSATAPFQAGTYTAVATFAGSTDYTSASASVIFTVAKVTSTVTVADAGGHYNGSPFPATATVTGLSGVVGTSLEGVAPTLLYYEGATAGGTGSATAPTAGGTYTVVATFPGSTDYGTSSSSSTFVIALNQATVSVTDAGGVYTGAPLAATALVAGTDGRFNPTLEGVTPTLLYYAGTTASGTRSVSAQRQPAPTPSWPSSPAPPITPALAIVPPSISPP